MMKRERLAEQYKRNITKIETIRTYEPTRVVTDAAVFRFRVGVRSACALLTLILRQDYGVECESYKQCLREAYANGLIPYNEMWLHIVDTHNALQHTYTESASASLYQDLPDILPTLKELEYLTSTTSF